LEVINRDLENVQVIAIRIHLRSNSMERSLLSFKEFSSPEELDSGATSTAIFVLHPLSASFEFELASRMVKALQIGEIIIS
jgi:hypothetical protein